MNLVSIDGLAKTLSAEPLFADLSLGIDEGERLGLVGNNGAGKTTLLKVLSGELEPDSGTLAFKRGLRVSLLEQRPVFLPDDSLRTFLYSGKATGIREYAAYTKLLEEKGHTAEAERLHRSLDAAGDAELEHRYLSLCTELGLADPEARLADFSGGMVKKAAIARCLAPRSDLILLDEPTNHLDIETIEWLEKRLGAGPFAFILVTHDRWFLDSVCSSILEIEGGKVYRHEGNYSAFLEGKAERLANLEKADSRRIARLRIELEWLNRGARARAGKSRRRKEKIRGMAAAGLERAASMEAFQSGESRLGRKVLELKELSKGYGGHGLFSGFSYEFTRGDRVGIVGPNGAGKTSLLDLIAGRKEADSGNIERGETLRIAYFDQSSSDLDPDMTVLDCVRSHAEILRLADGTALTAEQLLERFLFPREAQGLKIARLSGGERRRLGLVRLLAGSPNFLLLDEPTNDLDIGTIELLEDFLESFQGCVVAVSHDRAFLDRIASFLLVFDGEGGLREFPGSYSEWREVAAEEEAGRAAAESASSAAAGGGAASSGVSGANAGREAPEGAAAAKKKLSFAERREFDAILGELDSLEAEKAGLEALFGSASPDPARLAAANKRYAELGSLIEARTLRWEELSERA